MTVRFFSRNGVFLFLFLNAGSLFSFGQNKVQYQVHSWHYKVLPHFHLFSHENQGKLPGITSRWSEAAYRELSTHFSFTHERPVPLIVYGSPTLFQQTNVILELIPEGVGGFTELFKNRIVVPFTGIPDEYRHVLHHELVHAFQFGILYEGVGGSLLRNQNIQMPLWFAEGLAEFLSNAWDVSADMFLMDMTLYGTIPLPGPELSGYMAYKGGQSFLHFLWESRGDSLFHVMLRRFRDSKNIVQSLENTYKLDLSELGKQWRRELRRIYWPEIGRREEASRIATAITDHRSNRHSFNLKPRISPDGTRIAYYSDRKDYTRIFIVDRKGKIITQINQYGYGGYFESFHPFRGGLCWSPDGTRLAFVTVSGGQEEIRIVDISTKNLVRTIRPEVHSITSPDWSPAGDTLVFCGVDQDRTDLFLYVLQNDSLQRLTNDYAGEENPRFSPDGTGVMFSRRDSSGAADFTALFFHRPPSDLVYLDMKTGKQTRCTATPFNDHSPSFTGNGLSYVFVSDRNGIDNIYLGSPSEPDSARPITNLVGGCSSPDWARKDSTLVFCLFQKQGWNIWRMDDPLDKVKSHPLAPTRWREYLTDTSKQYFRPPPPGDSALAVADSSNEKNEGREQKMHDPDEALKDSALSEPAATAIAPVSSVTSPPEKTADKNVEGPTGNDSISGVSTAQPDSSDDSALVQAPFLPYQLRFSPDMVSVGLGISGYYGYAGQGMISLSDILGNHRIMIAGNINGRPDENIYLLGSYLNLRYRFDFGFAAFYRKDYAWASVYGTSLYHDTNAGGYGLIRYPFSKNLRIDFYTYYSSVSRKPYILNDNNYTIFPDTSRSSREYSILTPSLSTVFDNTLWGITGPVNGIRAEATCMVSPSIGSVRDRFFSFHSDIRGYLHFMKRFVWANKIGFGIALPFGEGKPARRFFLGGNENWINFDANLENYKNNFDNLPYALDIIPFRGWKYYGLDGSRFAVLNSEFRFPFIKELSLVWPLPLVIRYVNGAAFVDVGNAWDKGDQYEGIPLPDDLFGGVGFGLRANLGYFVVRFDRAWRTDWYSDWFRHSINYFSLGAEF